MRSLGLLWLSLRLGILNALQYRVNFVIQLVRSVVGLGTALAGIAVVFGQTDDLAGWSREEIVAVLGVFWLVGGLVGLVTRPSMEALMEGVRLGTLDFTLVKPADSQVLVSVNRVEVWRLVDVALGSVTVVVAVVGLGERVGWERAASFALMLAGGIAIIYSFLLILATMAFWLVRLENILVIFGSMYEAGRWPVGIYPPWLRVALTVAAPVAFAITIPVESLVGRLEPQAVVISLSVATAFLLFSRWFWRTGLKHYTGASA